MGARRKQAKKKGSSTKPGKQKAENSLAWSIARIGSGPAFFFGGCGLIPYQFWIGAFFVYLGFFLVVIEFIYDPRVLTGPLGLQVVLVCLPIYAAALFTIYFVITSAPIDIYSFALKTANYRDGDNISGIVWDFHFTPLRVNVSNNQPYDYQHLDFLIHPDKWIHAAVLIDPPIGCELHSVGGDALVTTHKVKDGTFTITGTRIGNEKNAELNDTEGNKYETVATEGGYRLVCDHLLKQSSIRVLFASVDLNHETLKPKPEGAPGSWAITPNGPFPQNAGFETSFGPRPFPTSVSVKGTYQRQYKPFDLDRDVQVKDGN